MKNRYDKESKAVEVEAVEEETNELKKAGKFTKYSVIVPLLNVRANPGREFKVLRKISQGEKIEIVETYFDENTDLVWARLEDGGWVDVKFIKRV